MSDQEKIVNLIIEIDNIIEDDLYEEELYQNPNKLDSLSDKLDIIFKNGINKNILKMINSLKFKNIFTINGGNKFSNNKIKIKIEKYLNQNNNLYLDYDLIKNNIISDYKLVNYLEDKNKIGELVDINKKVLLEIEAKYATKELIEKELLDNDFISEVFLGIYGTDNNIYKYSLYYKSINNIEEILFNQVKDKLSYNPTLFINASEIIKRNKKIQDLIIKIDKKFKAYIEDIK